VCQQDERVVHEGLLRFGKWQAQAVFVPAGDLLGCVGWLIGSCVVYLVISQCLWVAGRCTVCVVALQLGAHFRY
jgi:hypothetical protein